jgi:pSer/pThr/pTyr-binding forkhead associated (FHA) protein
VKVTVLKNNVPLDVVVWDGEIEEGLEVFVGRSEDCHVLIDDPLISRHHLVLRYERGQWVLEKLTNLAPLTVNGAAVQQTLSVKSGDQVNMSPYILVLDDLPGGFISSVTPASQQVSKIMPASADLEYPETMIDQPTISGMRDDIPAAVEIDATEFLPTKEPKTSSVLPTSERTQDLAENILEDDELASSELDSTIPLEDLDGPDDISGMGFKGEEDVIGSDSISSESTQAEGLEGDSFGGDFDANQSTEVDGGLPVAMDDGGDSTRVFQKFASYELLIFGEYAPYDKFALDKPEVFIGRDAKKCQIVLNDPEVSSVHAVLRKNAISITLEDANSSNGTLLNGQRINRSDITNGDEFIVGSTTFTVQVVSDLLNSERSRLMPVESGQVIERIEEVEEEVTLDGAGAVPGGVDFTGTEAPQEKSIIKRILKDPKKKRIAMILVPLLLLALLMDEETTPAKKPEPKKEEVAKDAKPADPKKPKLSDAQIQALEARYKIAQAYVKDKKLDEALAELEQILQVDPDYANAKTLSLYVQEQNKLFKEEQERLMMEAEKARIREEVKALLAEAREAVNSKNVTRAEQLFAQILEKDPENLEVTPLKQELDVWQAQERAKAEAEARAKAERQRQVDSLSPGKKLYLSKEWHKAIAKLEEFLTQKQMDEDLIKEASDMLTDAKAQMASEIAPIVGKARSLKEGQDLKGAYEAYLQVLTIDPTNKEGLDEVDAIRDVLDTRSKKIYREAIISESLSLFGDAKEKFQEVQQISPTDSEYYRKASEKLKNYLE